MALNPDFDYEKILALSQAVLVERSRLNSLGSYSITINYNQINSGTKEDCLEWLEANRLQIIDPTVSFKTYEGTWNCVTILYNEKNNIIQQVFKVDSALGDLGEPVDNPPGDYDLQSGDISRISDGMLVEKAYYWRVTSPDSVSLPETAIDGQIWTKTANDNGDGTYDVVVAREKAVDQVGVSETQSGPSIGGAYTETSVTNTNATELEFGTVANEPGKVDPAVEGEVKSISNVPLENGMFRTTVTTRTALSQDGDAEVKVSGEDGTEASNSIFVSGEQQYPTANQEYEFYYKYVCKLSGGSVTGLNTASFYDTGATNAGEIVYKSVLFSSRTLYDDDFALWYNGSAWIISASGDIGGSPSSYYSSTEFDGEYTGNGGWTGTASINYALDLEQVGTSPNAVMTPFYAGWKGVDDPSWEIYANSTSWYIIDPTVPITVSEHVAANLTSYGWDDANLIVQIGKNPSAYNESTVRYKNSEKYFFVSDGGVIGVNGVADPVDGEEISLTNTPLDNGKFDVTITTLTVNKQRVPALFDSIIYGGNGDPASNAIISAKNSTYDDFQADITTLSVQKPNSNNSVSVSINKYGRYDYTIRSVQRLVGP